MQNKPIVAITADRTMLGAHASHVVGEKYIAAIVDGAEALALLLPALGDTQCIEQVLSTVDGLLFTGSYSNVEPHRYGGAAASTDALYDPARDATTLPLLRAAIDAAIPVLAICRGLQELNVAFGGSLHHSVHAVGGLNDHRENTNDPLAAQYAPAHSIALTHGGLLCRLAQGATSAQVNSLHDQGVARLGSGLTVEAIAADGLIEAISVSDAPAFTLAVQWHPEWRQAEDPLSSAIFRAFGDACRQRMTTRNNARAAVAALQA